ncbi:MAG: dockerin type I repeat-containing protein, partial [Ruminococcus sp.]|nr:dockerin type I repeat-containing protein [Ruminococcus sp.]
MKKKRIVSALMAVAMCISALPVTVYAKSDTTAEMPEFTQKFIEECLMNPDESEENRLVHNLFNGYYNRLFQTFENGENMVFLGSSNQYINGDYAQYFMEYPNENTTYPGYTTIPGHENIKCVQCIYSSGAIVYFYIENPYITEQEFKALSYNEKLMTTGKIFDETGEYIAEMHSSGLSMFPYFIGEDGKAYDRSGNEIDIFNGKIEFTYCNPNESYICDGKKIYKYSDVYDGDPDNALRVDFYKYLEDNNVKEVKHFYGNQNAYYTATIDDYTWRYAIEDLSAETFITDTDGNIIPNDPDFLRIIDVLNNNVHIYVYNKDNKYIFEDVTGNRIVFSSFYYDEDNLNDAYILIDFFNDKLIGEELNTDNVIETYIASENELKIYNNIDILTAETLTGDANEDSSVSLADAVLIMQALSNPDDFSLTEQGRLNADFNGDGTIT